MKINSISFRNPKKVIVNVQNFVLGGVWTVIMADKPVTLTKDLDGSYTWSCAIEADYHRDSIRPGFYACIGIAVFLLVFGGILSWKYHDWTVFWIVAACAGVFMLLTVLLFGLAFSAENPQERFAMTETYVKTGSGRSSVYFNYKKAQTVILTGRYIELQGKTGRMRVYAPEEDFDFVRSYIQSHLPACCDIRCK